MFYLFIYYLIFHQYLNVILFVICFARTDNKPIKQAAFPSTRPTKLVHLQRRAWHSYQFILGGRLGRRILRGEQTIADGVLLPRCPRRTTATIPASSTFHQCSTVLERRQREKRIYRLERPGRLTERRCPARRQQQPGDPSGQSAVVGNRQWPAPAISSPHQQFEHYNLNSNISHGSQCSFHFPFCSTSIRSKIAADPVEELFIGRARAGSYQFIVLQQTELKQSSTQTPHHGGLWVCGSSNSSGKTHVKN